MCFENVNGCVSTSLSFSPCKISNMARIDRIEIVLAYFFLFIIIMIYQMNFMYRPRLRLLLCEDPLSTLSTLSTFNSLCHSSSPASFYLFRFIHVQKYGLHQKKSGLDD